MYIAEYTPDNHGRPLPGVQVRPAVMEDLPACAVLLASRDGGTASSWLSRLRIWLEAGQLLFVAVHQGKVVGYARLAWQTPEAIGGRNVPGGYYLSGIIVAPEFRRRGIGRALTKARCAWARDRGRRTYFVVNATNHASMDLHREIGFRELTRDFDFPGVTFTGGEGVLFGADASGEWQNITQLRVVAAR